MKCSFCGEKAENVKQLIAASDKVAICDACVLTCVGQLIYPDEDPIVIELGDETTEGDVNAQKDCGC